jgi:hypothetical protein
MTTYTNLGYFTGETLVSSVVSSYTPGLTPLLFYPYDGDMSTDNISNRTLKPYTGTIYPEVSRLVFEVNCTWGDYSGDLINRTNYEYLRDKYPYLLQVNYPYCTRSLILDSAQYVNTQELSNLLEDLRDMESWVLDENLMSTIESETIENAWSIHLEVDFTGEIRSTQEGYVLDTLDTLDDPEVQILFDECCALANTYPYLENAVSVYVDMRKLVPYTEEVMLKLGYLEVCSDCDGYLTRNEYGYMACNDCINDLYDDIDVYLEEEEL